MTFTYTTRPNTKGQLVVYIQYIHNEKRFAKSTGVTIGKKNWNPIKRSFVKINPKDQMLLDAQINSLKDFVADLVRKGESISVQNVKNAFNDYNQAKDKISDSESIIGLVEGFKVFFQAYKNKREKNTIKNYNTVLNDLVGFETKYKVSILLKDVNSDFEESFGNYLYDRNLTDDSHGLRFKVLKTALRWLDETKGVTVNQAYRKFKVKSTKGTKVFLTVNELKQLKEANLNSDTECLYRDIFLFQCNTGLAISDVIRVGKKHISNNVIEMKRFKTQKEIFVPLNQDAKRLLEKYDYQFPKIVEQVYNRNIKRIAKKAGIESQVEFIKFRRGKKEKETKFKYEVLSSHDAVKTFITLAADRGFQVSDIAAMTGKTPAIILSNYLGTDREGLKRKMENMW